MCISCVWCRVSNLCVVQIMLETEIDILSAGKGSNAKLSQDIVQRWVRLCNMVLRLLQKWDAIETCYVRKGDHFPLGKLRVEVSCRLMICLRVSCTLRDTRGFRKTFLHPALLL